MDTSDARLKKNVATLSDSLSRALQLRGVNFEWINQEYATGTQIGFIAQEVEVVLPEAVGQMGDYKTVRNDKLTALLAEAIKELNWKLEDLATTTEQTDEGSFTSRFFSSLFTRITIWLADATNGIQDFYASIVHSNRVETNELCVGSTCVTEEQFNSVFSNQSAAAGAPLVGSSEAPDGPSASGEPSADAATTTTPASPLSSTATPAAANDNQPIADAENEPEVQEAPPQATPEVIAEPVPIPEPANDNEPSVELQTAI